MSRAWVIAVATLAMVTGMTAGAPAAQAAPDQENLVTVDELDRASVRDDWRLSAWRRQFDCGAYAVLSTFRGQMARRGFVSDDAGFATEAVLSHRNRRQATAAHRRTVATIRSCVQAGSHVSLRTDEQQPLPGRARLLQLYSAPPCCGRDTHSFIVLQRGRRTALIKLGEGGPPGPRGPLRALAATASHRMVR